jgi:hypothetical protein
MPSKRCRPLRACLRTGLRGRGRIRMFRAERGVSLTCLLSNSRRVPGLPVIACRPDRAWTSGPASRTPSGLTNSMSSAPCSAAGRRNCCCRDPRRRRSLSRLAVSRLLPLPSQPGYAEAAPGAGSCCPSGRARRISAIYAAASLAHGPAPARWMDVRLLPVDNRSLSNLMS